MRKKMLLFFGVIVVPILAPYFVVDAKNKQVVNNSDNPYGKDKLKQETIDQLKDPLYQNQIKPEELEAELAAGENMTVYFYRTSERRLPLQGT
jgi:hypothetical protein